jgi:hypothetical protein
MLLAPKACILSTYFDQDEVHRALGYDPKAFMRERVERRRALLEALSETERASVRPLSKAVVEPDRQIGAS